MINKNISYLRKTQKLSQEDVAEKVGVSRQTIAKWEAGDSIPDVINCSKLAEIFNVTLDDLVHYKEEEMHNLPVPPKGKYMFGMVTVGDRGQIVIPVKARNVFDIKPGDNLVVLGDIEQGLGLIKSHYIMDMINSLKSQED